MIWHYDNDEQLFLDSTLPLTSTTLLLPVPTSYPDLVISHTPPTETNRNSNESIHNENLLINYSRNK